MPTRFPIPIIVSLLTKPKRYASLSVPNISPEEAHEVTLSDEEKAILHTISIGGNRLADFIDAIQRDGQVVNAYVESLEEKGLIARKGRTGFRFYAFDLTPRGKETLWCQLSDEEKGLLAFGLNQLGVKIPHVLASKPMLTDEIAQAIGESSVRLTAAISGLSGNGYVTDSGVFRRRLRITPKGAEIIEKVEVSTAAVGA